MDKTSFTLEEIRQDCSELENNILNMYLNRKKQKEIIEALDCTRSKIDHFVAKYKLTRFRDKSSYCMDETTININNPEYWYFLGLFASDGNLHSTGGSEVVQFTLKDKQPLEDIINIFNYTGTIKKYDKSKSSYYYLGIINHKLVNSLIEIFTEPHRKTDTLTYPIIPNKECESMFIRGFWDGDGCFTTSQNGRTMIGEMYCKSTKFMKKFKEVLLSYGINTTGNEENLKLNKDETTNFINFIYSYDSPIGIPRKRALALQHLYYIEHKRK